MSTGEPAADQHSIVIGRAGYWCAQVPAANMANNAAIAILLICFTRPLRLMPRGLGRSGGFETVIAELVGIEMWRARNGRVRWQIHRFPEGPQSVSHDHHVSTSLPAIPEGRFSRIRF